MVAKGSFVQRVQFSDALQSVFNDNVRHSNTVVIEGSRIKDLRASKHRFEVSQKPNMRITQNYEAMIGTAVTVARGRSGEVEAKSANDWLRDQTAETAIQTAMMGDAGDETLQLVRFFDA